jgi:hypothetical protein
MTPFASAGHLLSWAGLVPRLDESAGKRRSTRVRYGAPWLKPVLGCWPGRAGREFRVCPKKANLATPQRPNQFQFRRDMSGAPIMNIDKELRECFSEELIFASDEDRAFDWLISLRRRKIGWKQARAQIVEYLRSRNASKIHIRKQVDRARPMLTNWLED